MNNPKEKLKYLLEKEGRGSAKKLADYLEVPRSYISRWVNDEKYNFPYEYINEIASFFKIDPSYFITDTDQIIKFLPLIGSASCGVPTNHFYSDMGEYELIPIPASLYREGRYFVRAEGDSMLPKIHPGDEVLCDTNSYIENGNIVHYTLNNESSGIKKVVLDENGHPVMLVPLNDKHSPIIIKPDDKIKMAKCIRVITNL